MAALRHSVRDQTVAHFYLFSGPRGTGKTSSARILAKALNCEALVDGEPCCECASCLAVEAGSSLDVLEMDAASHGGVDDVRDLVSRVALGTPGRTKVYIVDEVHMLTTGASNALLKTLEEPPEHVVFVLATTDPQKVLPTIRSRAQHFEFRLLSADLLAEHLTWVAADAGIDLPDHAVDHAVRQGRGSARDALTALDAVIAAGSVDEAHDDVVDGLVAAVAERDTGAALVAVAGATAAGHDPRELADGLVARLRDGFLSLMAPELVELPAEGRSRILAQAELLGPAGVVRALDLLGEALLSMREAPDTRVVLEVALVRATRSELDPSPAALVERVERLERALRSGATAPLVTDAATATGPSEDPARPEAARSGGATASSGRAAARQAVDAVRSGGPAPRATPSPLAVSIPTPAAVVPPESAAPADGGLPSRDELTIIWADQVLPALRPLLRAMFASGRIVSVTDVAEMAMPNEAHREKCESRRGEVEAAMAAQIGRRVPLRLVVDAGQPGGGSATSAQPSAPAPLAHDDELIDLSETTAAPPDPRSDLDRVVEEFPGAVVEDT